MGSQEFNFAETEMLGLMAFQEGYDASKHFSSAFIAGCSRLEKIGVEPEKTTKDQSVFNGVTLEGPLNLDHYRL